MHSLRQQFGHESLASLPSGLAVVHELARALPFIGLKPKPNGFLVREVF